MKNTSEGAKKRRGWLGALLFFLLAAAVVLPIPVPVHRTVNCLELALDDPGYGVSRQVTISGSYRWRLIGRDSFDGSIQVEGYPLTWEEPLTSARGIPALTFEDGTATLEYGPWMEGQIFGVISAKPLLRRFVIQVFEPSPDGRGGGWSTEDGRCIVSDASTREEALAVLQGFSNQDLPPYDYWLE